MNSTTRINPFIVLGIVCFAAIIFMVSILEKYEFYQLKNFSIFTLLLGVFFAAALIDGINKEKIRKKFILKVISLPVVLTSFIGFSIIIYQNQNNLLTPEVSKWWGALSLFPFICFLFVYAIITKCVPSKGVEIKHESNPVLYWLLTFFYGFFAFVVLIYLIISG